MKNFHHASSPRLSTLRRWWIVAGFLTLLGIDPELTHAEALKSAQVSRVFNDVRLLPENQPARPAVVADTVTGKAAVQTGPASRTELTFSDRTLTRLGADSYFSFVNGTRDMNLGSGTILLQVPKGAGGATIHTAGVTAGVTGTTLMVEYNPKSYSKIVVLEGTVRASLTGRLGESVLVHAGEILIVPAKAKTLPAPVSLDLKVLYLSSGLITGFEPLPSRTLIDREINQQTKRIGAGQLQDASLFIVGRGTQVQAGNLSYVAATNTRITAQQGANSPVLLGGATASNAGKYGPLNSIVGNDPAQPGVYQINPTTTILTDPYITTNGLQDTGRIYRAGTNSAASVDGPADVYLLGAATNTPFTPVSSASFGTFFGAVGDIAAFHFTSLTFQYSPAAISTAEGPTNLAFIADAGITDGALPLQPSGPPIVNLNGLNNLLLATRQGSIILNGTVDFDNTDNTPTTLIFYAQGGSLNLSGTDIQVGGGINLYSDTGMFLENSNVATGNIEIFSRGPISTGLDFYAVSASGRVDIVTSNGSLNFNGQTIQAGGAVSLSTLGAGDLILDHGGITAGSALTLTSASGNLAVNTGMGLVSSNGQVFLQSTAGAVNFNGTATAQGQLVLQGAGNVATGTGANLASNGGNVYLYSANGTATNNGTITAAGTVYLEGNGVTQNGSVTGTNGLEFLSNADLTASGTATTPAAATVQAFGTLNVNSAALSVDMLKLQTFGNNGVLLIGGSSVLTGNSQLNLFASGSNGRIEFAGNTTLNSNVAAVLTAAVIRIDNNVTVTINGPTALLYANTLQFSGSSGDNSTSGVFGGNGAVLAGSYTSGSSAALVAAQGGGTTPAASKPGKPVAVKPTVPAPTYDGRFGLAALVAGSAPKPGAATMRDNARPSGGSKTAVARNMTTVREHSTLSRTTVLR